MSERERLAVDLRPALTGRILVDSDYEDVAWLDTLEIADRLLESDWLKAHDAEVAATALREHRHEWASWIEQHDGNVGATPLTLDAIVQALRWEHPAFGVTSARADEGDPR